MKQNVLLVFIAVMTLLTFAYSAAIVYNMEGSLGGEEEVTVKEDGVPDEKDVDIDNDSTKYYMKIGEIEGGSKDSGHKKWIDLLSYSHPISSSDTSLHSKSGSSEPFVIVKYWDESSPELAEALVDGDENDVTIHAVRYNDTLGANGDHYLTINITEARIVSIGSGDDVVGVTNWDTAPPTEEVTFVFGYIRWTYENEDIVIQEEGNFPDPVEETPSRAVDIFMKIEGIPGESMDAKHQDWIEILSYSHGVSSSGIPPKGIKMSAQEEETDAETIRIRKYVDRASPKLAELADTGESFNGTIEFYKESTDGSRGINEHYFTVKFYGGRIARIETETEGAGITVGAGTITEIIEIAWGTINMTWEEEGVSYEIDDEDIVTPRSTMILMDIIGIPDQDGVIGPGGRVNIENISILEFDHEVVKQVDNDTGLPSGNSYHEPVKVIKEVDKSSPILMQALLGGSTFEMRTRFYRISVRGGNNEWELVKEIRLENASVASIQNVDDGDGQHKEREHIAYCYQKITWSWTDGGITAEDDWEAPVT